MLSNTEEFKEKELKMKEEHYRRMEDKQMVFDYHEGKGKKKNDRKPTALVRLKKIYPEWCEANLEFDSKLPTKKNKEYYRTDVLREWEGSEEFGYWLDNHDAYTVGMILQRVKSQRFLVRLTPIFTSTFTMVIFLQRKRCIDS